MNGLINYEAIYRSAPGTPGLLIIDKSVCRTAPLIKDSPTTNDTTLTTLTCDRWGEVHFLSKFSAPQFSLFRCFEEIFTKDDSLNESMNNKGVCKTGLATSGLLTYVLSFTVWNWAELKSIVLYCTQLHPTILRCVQNLYMQNAQNSPKGNDENPIHNTLSKTPSAIFLA